MNQYQSLLMNPNPQKEPLMKKSNFVGGTWLIAYEKGEQLTEIDTSTISNSDLATLLKLWKMLGLTWIWDLRF